MLINSNDLFAKYNATKMVDESINEIEKMSKTKWEKTYDYGFIGYKIVFRLSFYYNCNDKNHKKRL